MSALLMKITDEILQTHDREKRIYLWLAYLQKLDEQLKEYRLSPSYRELHRIKKELSAILDHTNSLKDDHKQLIGFDLEQFKSLYKDRVQQEDIDQLLEDINDILLPTSLSRHSAFTDLKEFAYNSTKVEPIGIEQLYTKEGYAFVKTADAPLTRVYRYKISTYTNEDLRVKVYFDQLREFNMSISQSIESIKKELNNAQKMLKYNGYLIECKFNLPYEHTLLPIAKGSLVHFLSAR